MLDALHQTGRDARLIGQGNPDGVCSFIYLLHVIPSVVFHVSLSTFDIIVYIPNAML
jgi:hypothetical protein